MLSLDRVRHSISLAAESYGDLGARVRRPRHPAQGQLGRLGRRRPRRARWRWRCSPASSCWSRPARYLSHRWRWVARVAWAGMRAVRRSGSCWSVRTASTAAGTRSTPALVARVLLSGGVILITLMLLASVVAHADPAAPRARAWPGSSSGSSRIGAASVGLALVVLIVGQGFNGGEQTWWSSVPLYAVVPVPRRLHRRGGAALPALRRRGDRQPGRGARHRHGVRRGRLRRPGGAWAAPWRTGPTAASGGRCWPRWSWRWRSSRCDAGSSVSPTGWPTGAGPRRTTRWPTSAARIGQSPAPGELLPTIAAAAGEAVHADRAVVRLDGEGGAGLAAAWPSTPVQPTDDVSPDGDVVVPIEDPAGPLGSIGARPPAGSRRPAARAAAAGRHRRPGGAGLPQRPAPGRARRAGRAARPATRELAASRNRIIGAVDTERRRLESAIARQRAPDDGPTARRRRGQAAAEATGRRIARVRRPGDGGAGVAARADAGHLPDDADAVGARAGADVVRAAAMRRADALRHRPVPPRPRGYAERVEAAAYFCCVEVLGHRRRRRRHRDRSTTAATLLVYPRRRPGRARPAGDRRPGGGLRRSAPPCPAAPSGTALQIRFPASSPVPGPAPDRAPRSDHTCRRRVRAEGGLGDVRRRTAPGLVELVLVVRRQQDDDRAPSATARIWRVGLDAVDAREVDVHQDQVRLAARPTAATDSSPEATAPTTTKPSVGPRRPPSRAGTGPGRRRPAP